MEIKKGICLFCTTAACGVKVHVTPEYSIEKFEPDFDCPINPGKNCPRVRADAAMQYYYHHLRLNYPLKRIGERGSGKWEKISWNQAFDEIAMKLKEISERYGPECVATISGTGRNASEWAKRRFMNLLGSPNHLGISNICSTPYTIATCSIYGLKMLGYFVPEDTKCVLNPGGNPAESTPSSWKQMLAAKVKYGMKLITVDPRCTESARASDVWLRIRPGTDSALYLSMINVIIEESLYDRKFVQNYCYGFEELKKRASEYSTEKVSKITWLESSEIRQAARTYAENGPAYTYHGLTQEAFGINSVQSLRARTILEAICGNVDIEGGMILGGPHPWLVGRTEDALELNELLSEQQKKKQLGFGMYKLIEALSEPMMKVWGIGLTHWVCNLSHAPTAWRAMITGRPYPIKAFIVGSSNPMVGLPNTKLVYRALKSLDLLVALDFIKTPTVSLADYVLPSTCWLERYDIGGLASQGTQPLLQAGEPSIPPRVEGRWDRKHDYEIFRELGLRTGQDPQYWPWKTYEENIDWRLEKSGMKAAEFVNRKRWDYPPVEVRKYEKPGWKFATPTGKCELHSTVFEKLGYDPLPYFEEPIMSPISTPILAKEFPLILCTGGRFLPMHHSELRQVAALRAMHPDPITEINPEVARNADPPIADGDWVWIETPVGRIMMKARVTSAIHPQVVHIEHDWWFPEDPPEEPHLFGVWKSNANVIIPDDPEKCDKISGGWSLRALLCKVYKATAYLPR